MSIKVRWGFDEWMRQVVICAILFGIGAVCVRLNRIIELLEGLQP